MVAPERSTTLGVSEIFTETDGFGAGSRCRNCGAALTSRFCADCGQPGQRADHTLDLFREWFLRVFGGESILWDTLRRLVAEPGGLTLDWWAGRRARIMSPVRTLLVVLLGGSILATVEHVLVGAADVDVGKLLAAFTYQLVTVSLLVTLRLLPRLLRRTQQRTAYEVATFALYESAFLGLVAWTGYFLLIASNLLPPIIAAALGWIAPLVVPCAAALTLGHPVLHLKAAFGLSWAGAAVRILLLAAPIAIGMMLASVLLAITGVDRLWAPGVPSSETSTFQPAPPEGG